MLTKEAFDAMTQHAAIEAASIAMRAAGGGHVALPESFKLHDLERGQQHRARARGTMLTSSINDFADYTVTHAEGGARVFVDPETSRAVAVLNLGTKDRPGFADNLAIFQPRRTAEFLALLEITGKPKAQKDIAEFLEDWGATHGRAFGASGGDEIAMPRAVAAVRSITIKTMQQLAAEDGNLNASRSQFESVSAESVGSTLPTHFVFAIAPHHGLPIHDFRIRLGVVTGGDKPQVILRVASMDAHAQKCSEEVSAAVIQAMGNSQIPVSVGTYKVAP